MYKPCEHVWDVFVDDPDRPTVGVQQCRRCLTEIDRLHPLPLFREPDVDDELEALAREVFGPIAVGIVRRPARLAPTFLEPS